jgi:hypothetical protein
MIQGMLQVAGSGGYYYKVLTGRFVPDPRSLGLVFRRFVLGAPDPRSWILVPQTSFLGVLSWALLILVLGRPLHGRQ